LRESAVERVCGGAEGEVMQAEIDGRAGKLAGFEASFVRPFVKSFLAPPTWATALVPAALYPYYPRGQDS